jgi:hypothetical protein
MARMESEMIKGGCLCGEIRYEAASEPLMTAVCHCTHCQKQSGTAFGLVVAVPKESFLLQGEIKTYHDQGDSGLPVDRSFCPNCGSLITTNAAVMGDLTFIKAGTLDDTSWVKPSMQMLCSSGQEWVKFDELPAFAKMPE